MAKYGPLKEHLVELASRDQNCWQTSFWEIETILGKKLPVSARRYSEWWANENPVLTNKYQCKAWGESGWKTLDVCMVTETVKFIRQLKNVPTRTQKKTPAKEQSNMTIEFQWRYLGDVFVDRRGRLNFPKPPNGPSVYRLVIESNDAHQYYIGETDNIRRRIQGYRTPGLTQTTNIRLKTIMENALKAGNQVYIETMQISQSTARSCAEFSAGFQSKFVRRALENTAILKLLSSQGEVLNL